MKKLLTLLFLLVLSVQLLAQNPDFEKRFQAAQDLYNKGQFEQARTAIANTLNTLTALSDSQIRRGRNLSAQCDQAIADRDRLEVVRDIIELSFGSTRDSISFVAARPHLVKASSSASWCRVEKVSENRVYFRADMNVEKKSSRQAVITLSMGKDRSCKVTIVQKPRPDAAKQVSIRTFPGHASLAVDEGKAVEGVWEGQLDFGPHRVHAEKTGYFAKDTVINVTDDSRGGQVVLPLSPTFGLVRVSVLSPEGNSFDNPRPYKLSVNGRKVEDQDYSFDVERDIVRYSLYQDGIVPVPVGLVTVAASGEAFEPECQDVQVKSGEVVPVTLTLRARSAVADVAAAVEEVPAAVEEENPGPGELEVYVAMARHVPYVFDSTPSDARVTVDGEYIGNTPTPPFLLRETEAGRSFQIEVSKNGYLTAKEELILEFGSGEIKTLVFPLQETTRLKVRADADQLQLTVKNGRWGDTTFVEGVTLPSVVELPLRKKPYYVELQRPGQNFPAYRGRLRFSNAGKKEHFIQSWSRTELVPLAVSMNLLSLSPFAFTGGDMAAGDYKLIGTANLMRFRIVRGLSTSALRGMLFLPDAGAGSWAKKAPAVTCAFLNGDFRIGGGLFDYLDVDLLASYAWYPTFLKNFLGFTHVTGHDLFAGIEFSSRLPIFNLSLRAGWQMYPNLTLNLYDSQSQAASTAAKYTAVPLSIPNMWVIGVEITLGGKGNALLRVF